MSAKPKPTREQIKAMLLKAEALKLQQMSPTEIADELGVKVAQLRNWQKMEDKLFTVDGPWKIPFKGWHWHEMPGADDFTKRCNFALFKRGWFDPTKQPDNFTPFKRRGRGRPRKKTKLLDDSGDDQEIDIAQDKVSDAPGRDPDLVPEGEGGW